MIIITIIFWLQNLTGVTMVVKNIEMDNEYLTYVAGQDVIRRRMIAYLMKHPTSLRQIGFISGIPAQTFRNFLTLNKNLSFVTLRAIDNWLKTVEDK